ncbi:MAG: rubredoxin-like domain-containing protein [Candidatus Helarchaeota archaeon]
MARWRCTVCGWTCSGELPDCPPEKCPKCGAPRSKFVELK